MQDERRTEREPNSPIVLDPAEETVIVRLDSWPLDPVKISALRLAERD